LNFGWQQLNFWEKFERKFVHIVIFITLMGLAAGTHGAFGWIWGYTPS